MQTQAIQRQAAELEPRDDAAWLTFLSRWALLTALAVVGLYAVFMLGLGFDDTVPQEVSELVQGSRHPAVHRLAHLFNILQWVGTGGTLLAFAALAARVAPIRALLIAGCGVGQVGGVLAGFLGLITINGLAMQYAVASPDRQAALVQAHLVTFGVALASHSLSYILYGVGFALIASVLAALAGFPRWLTAWCGLAGILGLVWLGSMVLGSTNPVPGFFILYSLLAIVGLHLAIAAALWRRASDQAHGLATTVPA
jgi:hypothetical protein